MRRTLISVALVLISLGLFAQYSFDLHLDEDSDQKVYDIIETDNSYILVGTDSFSPDTFANGYIIELEKQGEITQELIFPNELGGYFFFNIHQYADEYYILASKGDSSASKSDLALLKFDQNLDLIDEHLINMPEGYWYSYMNSIIDSDTNIVIGGYATRSNGSGLYRSDPLLFKLNMLGDSLSSKLMVVPQQPFRNIYDLLEKPDSSGYYAFGAWFDHISGGEILTLNKELDSIRLDNIPNGIAEYYSPIYLSDTTFVVYGNGSHNFNAEDEVAISVFDKEMNSLYYQHFTRDEDMQEHPSMIRGLSKNDDYIYMGSFSNFNPPNPFYSNYPSWYHLVKMDYELNVVWEKYFGGDAYYFPYSILATEDGGCIMAGNRYDGEQYHSRDIYIVKVNSEGLIVWTQEIDLSDNKSQVFPNPGKAYLELHTGIYPATLQLHNLNGHLVLEEVINSNVSRVNTLELSSGTYIWSLVKEGELVESGKWIRE